MFSNWMLQSKNFNPENVNTSGTTLNAPKEEFHGGNHGELNASKSTGKYAYIF